MHCSKGLFRYLGEGAKISNLGIVDANVQLTNDNAPLHGVGILAALSGNSEGRKDYEIICVRNCYTTGIVSGEDNVGGLIGYAGATMILNSYSKSTVYGKDKCIGGLVVCNT